MNADLAAADLDLIRRVAAAGTLSAAARALGIDQTTAARRLARIEKRLGAALFDRVGTRSVPTPLTAAVLPDLAAMAEAAARAGAGLARRRAELAGTVRITSVGTVQAHILAPALAGFSARRPGISLDLDVSDGNASFAAREADIAVRLGRGEGDDTAHITRLGTLRYRLYRRRAPETRTEATPAAILTYTAARADLPEMRLLARLRPTAPVIARADRPDVLAAAARATGAEVMLPDLVGDADPMLARVADADLVAERDVFRLVHPQRGRDPAVAAARAWVDATVRAALTA